VAARPQAQLAYLTYAARARELRKKKEPLRPVITLRLKPDVLAKYKALGRGYTGIMAMC
jgi:uncharacterized protein (DUF4415 family)